MTDNVDFGEVAYVAYGHERNWLTAAGERMPQWAEQREDLQAAWQAAAAAVIEVREGGGEGAG